jgi:hypothetical protein
VEPFKGSKKDTKTPMHPSASVIVSGADEEKRVRREEGRASDVGLRD